MNELTERQKKLLMLAVRDYIDTAQPVGSQRIVEHFGLDVSSATVRNELLALTEMGYLRQPHTSAGRVPTEEGYRYFVSHLPGQADLSTTVQAKISNQFLQARPEMDQWMTLAASVLAHQSQAVSLVTAPHTHQARFKHVELISTQGRQVLMVLVFSGGEVTQQILTLAEPVTQERLSQTANRLNENILGRNTDEMNTFSGRADALEHDILSLITADMRRADDRASGEIYLDGLTNVFSEPEFSDTDDARKTLRMLEERSQLQELLSRAARDNDDVKVLIGGEGEWEELKQCSIVLARYGVPGMAGGTLGVLGPMRMAYAKTIPTVKYVAGLLSNLVSDS